MTIQAQESYAELWVAASRRLCLRTGCLEVERSSRSRRRSRSIQDHRGPVCLAGMMLRRALLALFSVVSVMAFGQVSARADCAGSYVQAWPEAGATGVPTNAHVLVHTHADGLAAIDPAAIGLRHAGSGQAVPLRVVRDFRVSAAYLGRRTLLLQPVRALAPATRYRLVVRAVSGDHERLDQSFVTASGPDTIPPAIAAATAGTYHTEELGCGPERTVPVVLRGVTDAQALRPWVRLRVARSVADLRAGRLLGEVLEPADEQGNVSFGHGMCSGNWPLAPGDRLVLGVSALDAALNESAVLDTMVVAGP